MRNAKPLKWRDWNDATTMASEFGHGNNGKLVATLSIDRCYHPAKYFPLFSTV
jgi:hypothetical protein